MIIHMLSIFCQSWNRNHLFAFFYSPYNCSCTSMRNQYICSFFHFFKIISVKKLFEEIMFWLIITIPCLCKYFILNFFMFYQIIYCFQQTVKLNLFANLRPAYLYKELKGACPLRDDIIGSGFDMMIMRELTGGLYFGERSTKKVEGVITAVDTLTYTEKEIRRIAVKGFDIAMKRRKKVTSVDKANVLDSSRLWRNVVEEVALDYPEVTLEHMLVDNCAMQLVKDPKQFDVILTENMFGDILSDEASMVTGSIGMLSSASLNDTKFGLYEPSGGSAPDIAGKGIANPIATILSAAMMLRYSFDLDREADAVEAAVRKVLEDGFRTIDIMPQEARERASVEQVGTAMMGDLVSDRI